MISPQIPALFAAQCPGFFVDPDDVDVLSTPEEFYDALELGIDRAEDRILLSSLYLGTDDQSLHLVKMLEHAKEKHPQMPVHVLLDRLRGARMSKAKHSSVTMLQPAVADWAERGGVPFRLSLIYSLPRKRYLSDFMMNLMPRIRELLGVHHMKFYVFDNTVIISGANLSKEYYNGRQDRYVRFRDCKELADWFQRLADVLATGPFCTEVSEETDAEKLSEEPDQHYPRRAALADYCLRLKTLLYPNIPSTALTAAPSVRSESVFADSLRTMHDAAIGSAKTDASTVVFPTLQMAGVGLLHDSTVTEALFAALAHSRKAPQLRAPSGKAVAASLARLDKRYHLDLATGYFNLPDVYLDALLPVPGTVPPLQSVSFLGSSPEANGFFSDPGAAGLVPRVYANILDVTLERFEDEKSALPRRIYEWSRDGWTFHGKGLWLSEAPPQRAGDASDKDAPHTGPASDFGEEETHSTTPSAGLPVFASIVGSSNFGDRSLHRDSECQLALFTTNAALSRKLQCERDALFASASLAKINAPEVIGKGDITKKTPLWAVRVMARLLKSFL